jgi:acetyl-CoA carboxylase carboxyl transferase subunit beta
MDARLAVGAVVFRQDGAVLLVQRGRPPRAGSWSLPGGKVEEGESIGEAVEREVLEETGLAVVAGPVVEVLTLSSDGYRYRVHDVRCTLRDPASADEASPGDDARDVRWCHDADLDSLGVTADVRRVVRAARLVR